MKRYIIYFILLYILGLSIGYAYPQMDDAAKTRITTILKKLKADSKYSKEKKIQYLTQLFINKPYRFAWQGGLTKKNISAPLFNTEHFDCVTYVQMILALLHAKDIQDFETRIIHIAFDVAPKKINDLDLYQQNHFIDADWNRVNESNGILKKNQLMRYAKPLNVTIDKENWFKTQRFPQKQKWPLQNIVMRYLPKDKLIVYDGQKFVKNTYFYNKISTPAVIEIIRDPKLWRKGRHYVRDMLGSETSVSHMGILFHQNFKYGQLIYHKIICPYRQTRCVVMPVYCKQSACSELMLSHATISYPNRFFWYETNNGFNCGVAATKQNKMTLCNRVENIPLFNYLTDLRDGYYNYMMDVSIVGFYLANI